MEIRIASVRRRVMNWFKWTRRDMKEVEMSRKLQSFRVMLIGFALLGYVLISPHHAMAEYVVTLQLLPFEGMTATASDYHDNYEPSLAIDGSTENNSRWEARPGANQWIRIDLGARYHLGRIESWATWNRFKDYKVYVSNDAESLGELVAEGEQPNSRSWNPIDFDITVGRYVTLEILTVWGSNLHIHELRFYAYGGDELTLRNPVTGSATYTATNTVEVTGFPLPILGYDLFILTNSVVEPTEGWQALDLESPPQTATFSVPDPEGEVEVYAWFKDSLGENPTTNHASAAITYIRESADLTAVANEAVTVPTWGAADPALVRLWSHIEDGSSSSLDIFSYAISCPEDLSPDDPERVRLADPGDYTVTLTVMDIAGNIEQDTTEVTVIDGTAFPATTWTGGGASPDWFDHDNWSDYAPGSGSAATVDGDAVIRLPDATSPMGSFTMTGGTLTFEGWQSALRADTVDLQGGTLTLPDAFDEGAPSNRVWIVCDDFTLASGATIDADEKGYAMGHGPGLGEEEGDSAHGGLGRVTFSVHLEDNTYGNKAWPTTPGSGSEDGDGGGVVTIQADNQVTIKGLITADGSSRTAWNNAASGGSILISCQTIQGDSGGWLRARGGTESAAQYNGGGGGGRIAVLYESEEQAALPIPNPGIRFSARAGDRPPSVTRYQQSGTLYLSDTQFLSSNLDTQWDDVRLYIPGFTEWETNTLTISGRIAIPDLRRLNVSGNVTLEPDARLELIAGATNGVMSDYGMRFDVGGHLDIQSGSYLVLRAEHRNGAVPYVECGRLTVANGAWITAFGRGFDPDHGPGVGSRSASHGGIAQGTPGPTYNEPQAPILPGSGGALSGNRDSRGGGSVRISARGKMVIDGTICANPMPSLHGWGSNGSGGSILLSARRIIGTDALLRANGATGGHGSPAAGGGRIALWTPYFPPSFVRRMADAPYMPSGAEIDLYTVDTVPGFNGIVNSPWNTLNAELRVTGHEAGSVFFGSVTAGTLMMIR